MTLGTALALVLSDFCHMASNQCKDKNWKSL